MMDDVTFSEEVASAPRPTLTPRKGMAQNLIRWGFAKDETSANYLLIGVIVVCALLAVVPLLLDTGSELPPESVLETITPPSR